MNSVKLMDWAELMRVSNLPTCISNVLVGAAVGMVATSPESLDATMRISVTVMAIMLLYVGGMALNDVVDAEVDRTERPGRVIPSGRISRAAAMRFAIVTLLVGAALPFLISVAAGVASVILAVVIVAYDLLHQRTPLSVVLMGACRGLVYVVGTAAFIWPPPLPALAVLAGLITLHIILLSIVARAEVTPRLDLRRWLALVIPFVPLAILIVLRPEMPWWWTAVVAAAMVLWLSAAGQAALALTPHVPRAVMGWLSGICLIDAFFLMVLDIPIMAGVALVCFALTAIAHRRILGT